MPTRERGTYHIFPKPFVKSSLAQSDLACTTALSANGRIASTYYIIFLDSTPDISKVDQLAFIVRYVLPTGPVERLINISGYG